MRKAKMLASAKLRTKVVQHTPKERLAMRRHKRKFGPSGVRRQERRAHLQKQS